MKRRRMLGVLLALSLAGLTITGQNAPDLYQQALVQERAAGNLEQAILLFQRAAKESTNDRVLAAKALLGAARSYEKLGQPQARKAYEEIARTYPELHEQSAMAKERFAALPATFGQQKPDVSAVTPMLTAYCITCHNQARKVGGLALDQVDPADVAANTDVWERVLRRLRSRTEPPFGRPRPDAATYDSVIGSLESALDRANPATLNAADRVNDLELAARLAAFLWSGSPDGALLDVARRGQLKDPAVLEQQTRRMLADPKSEKLATDFFAKWLHLDNLDNIHASPVSRSDVNEASRQAIQRSFERGQALFPEWDEDLRNSLRRETELFLDSQVRTDRPATELWTANYTFVNERLGHYYGIPNISGSQFQRVAFSGDRRAGLLGQGSILTITSVNDRVSPTLRGKWLLGVFFGFAPPPPPPNVPPLDTTTPGTVASSTRQRNEEHNKNPSCASCHAIFDPLGFALGNFDAIGRWQDLDGGFPVDASGAFIDGTRFNGPAEFRAGLLQYRDAFVTNVTERLLNYAVGRGTEPGKTQLAAMPSVRAILRAARPSDYRWSSIILGIVQSAPFQQGSR